MQKERAENNICITVSRSEVGEQRLPDEQLRALAPLRALLQTRLSSVALETALNRLHRHVAFPIHNPFLFLMNSILYLSETILLKASSA